MIRTVIFTFFSFFFLSCQSRQQEPVSEQTSSLVKSHHNHDNLAVIDPKGMDLESRIGLPKSFERIPVAKASFGQYLRKLPLKKAGEQVRYYDGKKKVSDGIYMAVLDQKIGRRDLHQCADAAMRLRADYLRANGREAEISFHLTNGFEMDYASWAAGNRLKVNGNKVSWDLRADSSVTDKSYWSYLESLWTYAGTLSLSKEMKARALADMQIGDLFVQGGSPGHAVIVLDMAINKVSGEKLYLLGQSYMPAQEMQVLINPNDHHLSPWYSLKHSDTLKTPEWDFVAGDLKTW